jgi:hypothetical protein
VEPDLGVEDAVARTVAEGLNGPNLVRSVAFSETQEREIRSNPQGLRKPARTAGEASRSPRPQPVRARIGTAGRAPATIPAK